MKKKLVSVVIPAYNAEKYLREAIESVLAQTFKNYEIIVVDDGSTDETASIAESYGEQVTLVRQENRGLGGARNMGILSARGELIGLLDADDQWMPDYLEEMVRLSRENPSARVFYCMAQCMDMNGNDLPQVVGGPPVAPELLYQTLLRANFIIPSTIIFHRQAILDAGLFEEKNRELHGCEDWDLWLRLSPSHKFVGTAEPLVRYRLHANTFSANSRHMQKAVRSVIEKNFGLDDGKYADWSAEKKRAFGGVYLYQTITFVQRQRNWDAAEHSFRNALIVDPSLAIDPDFFYELGLGSQPVGVRGTTEVDDFESNAFQLEKIVRRLKNIPTLEFPQRKAIGTAEFALGLIAYNIGKRSASRRYFLRALLYRPELLANPQLSGDFLKSFIDRRYLNQIKNMLRRES